MSEQQADLADNIKTAHPTLTGRHDLYAEAHEMVSCLHAKSDLTNLVNYLLARIDAAEKERDDLRKTPLPNIKDFRFTQQPGLAEGFFQDEFVPLLADALYGTMQEAGAVNFVEFIVHAPKHTEDAYDRYILTFQKANGLTPGEKLAAAEETLNAVKAENKRLTVDLASADDNLRHAGYLSPAPHLECQCPEYSSIPGSVQFNASCPVHGVETEE